jgi:integrase
LETGDLWAALTLAGLAPRTVKLYMRTIWTAAEWFDDQGLDLDRAAVLDVVRYARTKPQTYSSLGLLRWSLGRYWELVEHPASPASAIRVPPAPKGQCLALEEDDARILAKAARSRGDRQGFAVCLGLYAALRCEEIASLPWSAFGEEDHLRIVGKGSKTRRFPLHPVLGELRTVLPNDSRWVFRGLKGTHVCTATVWGWVRAVADDAGVPFVRPHRLRHTCLATANDKTGDLRATQDFAGHSKPETTARYTRSTGRRLRTLVNSLDY